MMAFVSPVCLPVQLGVAAACAFVKLLTGIGVEDSVAMTGIVSPSGAIRGVGGLEGKLGYANSTERYKVVVVPEDNREEAQYLIQEHGWSIKLLPVSHMGQVLAHLHLRSVTEGTTAIGKLLRCPMVEVKGSLSPRRDACVSLGMGMHRRTIG